MDTLIEAKRLRLRFSAPTDRKGSLKKWVLDAIRGRIRHQGFLAVDDVSFSIRRGESVGLVGRNGAGKSTLLKLVTGIVNPTSGSIAVRGQVAPLLALGNGLDPTLTGRENIYLNGAILGYEKAWLRTHEADIIDFSELGDFIDAPVRTYSSGMTMRLAFSIATAATPEILILDEVLAVGDAAFQTKCKARIGQIIKDGATVFFAGYWDGQVAYATVLGTTPRVAVASFSGYLFGEFSKLPFIALSDILPPGPADGSVPVARFHSKTDGRHFLTARRSEMCDILAKLPDWICDGIAFRAFAEPRPETVPLRRFCSLRDASHVFVVNDDEAASYRAAPDDWREERPVCFVYRSSVSGSIPVFVRSNPAGTGFLYKTEPAVKDDCPSFFVLPEHQTSLSATEGLPA